jgi:hemerythrin-like domain-containing protein
MVFDLAQLIVAEHHVIVELMQALETDREDRFQLAHRLIDALAAHTAAEQQIFYPALRDIVPGGADMANQAQTDHQAMRAMLVTLETSYPGESAFEDALRELAAELRRHMPVEENEHLPALGQVIGQDKMLELGRIYTDVREHTPSGLQAMPPADRSPKFQV